MSHRFEITVSPDGLRIDGYTINKVPLGAVALAIRQLLADIAALKDVLAGEVEANQAFRQAGGALDGEDMPTFCARIIAERDQLRAEIADSDDLARHFVRDRPTIKARGALILQADEIAKLRARLAAVDAAPTVAIIVSSECYGAFVHHNVPRLKTSRNRN